MTKITEDEEYYLKRFENEPEPGRAMSHAIEADIARGRIRMNKKDMCSLLTKMEARVRDKQSRAYEVLGGVL